MPRKIVPISARITPEDAAFIDSLDVEGARTPSQKLRAIIADARRRKLGTGDYAGALRVAEELLAPAMHVIRTSEHTAGIHSEIVSRLDEWLAECLAYLVSSNGADAELDAETLTGIEAGLTDRVIILMQSMLQMAITRRSPSYDPEVICRRIEPVLDLSELVSQRVSERISESDPTT